MIKLKITDEEIDRVLLAIAGRAGYQLPAGMALEKMHREVRVTVDGLEACGFQITRSDAQTDRSS